MKVHKIKKDNDELYTPQILTDMIKPFLVRWVTDFENKNGRKPLIWLPFDKDSSEFCYLMQELGFNYFNTHIDINEGDFFKLIEHTEADLVISNPPFSRKLEVFQALNKKGIPWALLMNLECLNYQVIGNYFVDNPIGLIIPDKKVSYDSKTSMFNTSYFCSEDFFKGVTFVHLEHNNSGKNYIPSRMYGDK